MGQLAIYESPDLPGALLLNSPAGGAYAELVGNLSCQEPEHLATWLEVQLRAAGRTLQQDGAYRCSYPEVEALARDFVICSADRSLRQTTATEALRIRETYGRTPPEEQLRFRLLKLAHDWGSLDASRELLAAHVQAEEWHDARRVLDEADFPEIERLLLQAEVALAEGDLGQAGLSLHTYFDRMETEGATVEADNEQIVQILQVCVQRPELQHLTGHPLVAARRRELLDAAAQEGLTDVVQAIRAPLHAWLLRHRISLSVAAAVCVTLYLVRATVVPVLLVLLPLLGLGGLVLSFLRRRKK